MPLEGNLQIGIVGIGNIGSACARFLLSGGYRVITYDKDQQRALSLRKLGAQVATSLQNLANSVDVLITALPAPVHVRTVMETEGCLGALKKGAIWIDHTSTSPDEVKHFSDCTEAHGIRYLEAPLTGGLTLLQHGQMTVYMGGDKTLSKECLPILQCYTGTQLFMGSHGTAAVVKIVSNMLCATHTVIAGEALMLAKRAGVDLRAMFDGVRASAGNSFVWETEVPLVFNGTFDPGFTLQLHCKDLGIGYDIAKKGDVPIEVFTLVQQIYNRARVKYGEKAGSSHPAKLLQDDLETSLQVEGFEEWDYGIQKVNDGIAVVHKGLRRLDESCENTDEDVFKHCKL